MRRLPLILFSLLLHGYVGLRLMPSLAGWSSAGPALGVLLATSAWLLPFSLIGGKLRWAGARTALVWSGMPADPQPQMAACGSAGPLAINYEQV